jgi:hypothetical protein
LKFNERCLYGFPNSGNARGLQHFPGLAAELAGRRIKKIFVLRWRHCAKQNRPDMHGPVSRGPFQALETLGKVN